MRCGKVSEKILGILRDDLKAVYTASEADIRNAIRILWLKAGQKVEGAGALPLTVLANNPMGYRKRHVVLILSGGNIDDHLWNEIVGTTVQ